MIQNDSNYKNLEKLVPKLLKIDLYKDKKFECCPHCGNNHFTKHGKYNGIQRYMCKGCRRTFSKTTNSLWYYSKKDSMLWIKYIELLLQRKTLRECANELKINLATSFYWRHKILNVLKLSHIYGINPDKLKGDVFTDTIYFQENSYNSVINFKRDYYFTQKIIIAIAARGSEDSLLILPLSRHSFDGIEFKNKILPRLEKKSLLISDGRDRFLRGLIERYEYYTFFAY